MVNDEKKKSFVAYLDEDGNKRSGFFHIISFSENWIELDTDKCILKIPHQRILKIKEYKGDE